MTALEVTDASPRLSVSEVFGPTVQGEGPSSGRRCGFVRLGRCNLDCGSGPGARWACDTPYTWDWTGKLGTAYDSKVELRSVLVADLFDEVTAMGVDLVVISGGEPLVQRVRLAPLVSLLLDAGIEVEIETNGTISPGPNLGAGIAYNVSPKLSCSGVERDRAIRPDVLHELSQLGARFKFVAADVSDLDEVAEIVELVGLPASQVWVMPAGVESPDVTGEPLRLLMEAAIDRGWNCTTRLHVAAWGPKRGV